MDESAGHTNSPSHRDAGLVRPRPSQRRAVLVGFGISAVLHVVGLLLYPSVVALRAPTGPAIFVPAASGRPAQGLTVIEVVAVDGITDPETPLDPEEVVPVEGPAVRPGAPDVGDAGPGGLVAPGPTAAERLRPALQDPRLWAPLSREINDLTTEQRLELELAGRIEGWQDSLSLELERERAITDWTTTDAQGRKWGISPGKIHLGDVTLPLPFSFGVPVGQRDEINRATWEWEEIRRGAATGELRDSWKERARAIRERRDRERAAAKPDTTGGRR